MGKPLIVKLVAEKDGNILLSSEELQKIVDDAYYAGFCDGASMGAEQPTPNYPPITAVYAAPYPYNYVDRITTATTDLGVKNGNRDKTTAL